MSDKKLDTKKPAFRTKRVKTREDNKQPSVQTQKIKEELTSIYENTDGSLPDMTTFERRARGSFFRSLALLIFSLILLVGAVYAGLFYLDSDDQFSKKDVLLSIKGEEIATNGEQVTYRISYRNAQKVSIMQARLQVRYPEGFVFESASTAPQNEAKNEWALGSLDRNESGYIDIVGKLFGNSGEAQSIRVFFTYLPANFSSEFQSVETFSTMIDDSAFAISIEGVDSASTGVDLPLLVRIKPQDAMSTSSGMIIDVVGMNMVIVASSPEMEKDSVGRIKIPDFSNEITIPLTVRFSQAGTKTVSVIVSQEGKTTEEEVILTQANKTIVLQNTDVSLSFAVNGTSADLSVRPGDMLTNTINIKNTSSKRLDNAKVLLSFDTPSYQNTSMLKWSAIEDKNDGTITGEQLSVDVRRGDIVWDKNQISALASLEPGEEINIDVTLPLKNVDDTDLSKFPNGNIVINSSISFEEEGVIKTVASEPITLTVQSDVSLQVRYNVVGNMHTITWVLENSLHELNNIVLEASAIGDVVWQQDKIQKSAGNVSYDEKSKKVRWEIPLMPLSVDVNTLSFAFRLNSDNPTQTVLMSKVKLSARDTVVNQDMLLVGDEVKLK